MCDCVWIHLQSDASSEEEVSFFPPGKRKRAREENVIDVSLVLCVHVSTLHICFLVDCIFRLVHVLHFSQDDDGEGDSDGERGHMSLFSGPPTAVRRKR